LLGGELSRDLANITVHGVMLVAIYEHPYGGRASEARIVAI
jgi:hypothetical protein